MEKYYRMFNGVMKDEQGNRIKEDVEYVKRDRDNALIPCVEGNADYQQYLKDVSEGAEVTDFDYEAEDARQAAAELKPKPKTLEERVDALEELNLTEEKEDGLNGLPTDI